MTRILFICVLVTIFCGQLFSQEEDPLKRRMDSLEQAHIDLKKQEEQLHTKIDSLNSVVTTEYINKAVFDTIVGLTETKGVVYEKPDILSKKAFRVRDGEIIIIIGFQSEWFKIIHKKGVGYILDEHIKHDDKIYSYKKYQSSKAKKEE